MIINGNALHIPLADNSVQMVCTSPPYWGLRSYLDADDPNKAHELGSEPTPEEYVAKMVAVFREIRRVLRKDGTCFLNLGDTYSTGTTAGRPEKSPNGTLGEDHQREQNKVMRNGNPFGLDAKQLVGIPWRVAFALQADGWWLRSDIIWHKPNPMPESVTDRPTKAHEYIFLLTKAANYYYDATAVMESASGSSAPGRANGTPPRRSALGPELSTTLYTDDGSTTCRGWHDLSQLEIGIGASMTTETECFKVIQDIRLKIGIETPERTYMVNLKVNSTYAATAASIAVPLDRLFSHGGPVKSAVPDSSTTPCGAILAGHIGADPFTSTLEGAKVTALECAMIPGEFFAARLTLERDGFSATLFVWSTLWSAHVTSFIPEGSNSIAQFTGTRNRRTVWTIPTSPYSGSHFATFPPDLVRPCILAGTSPRACEKCGAPWERVVEKDNDGTRQPGDKRAIAMGHSASGPTAVIRAGEPRTSTTIGFQPTCTCDNTGTGRSIVLDPFAGTFTVGMVAAEYGRRAVGVELSPEYIKLAMARTAQARAQGVMAL